MALTLHMLWLQKLFHLIYQTFKSTAITLLLTIANASKEDR